MPQIGWSEMLLIVVIAIIIIGPKDVPIVLNKIGSWVRSIKKYFNTIQREVSIFENENLISNEKIYENKKNLKKKENNEKIKKDKQNDK